MSSWTPEAQEYLEGYLKQVSALARSRDEDADDITTDLREHIESKVEEIGGALLTLEQLLTALSAIGTPQQVVDGTSAFEEAVTESNRKKPVPPTTPAPQPAPQPQQVAPIVVRQTKPSKATSFLSCSVALLILTIVAMVVIPVLGILAAIAIPNLARARANARQAEVKEVLKTIAAYQVDFQALGTVDENGDGIGDYATLDQLRKFADDSTLGAFQHEYGFDIVVTPGTDTQDPAFTCTATTNSPSKPGHPHFSVDQTGEVKVLRESEPNAAWDPEYIP